MPKLIKAESYKLFHSVYLWLIGLGFFLLNSSLIPDYLKRGFTWLDGSLYIGKFFFFMIAALAVIFLGSEFEQRVIQHYVTAGNSRNSIFWAKSIVFLLSGTAILEGTLFIHAFIGLIFKGEPIDYKTMLLLIPAFIAECTVPLFFGFLFRDIAKTLAGGLIFFVITIATLNTADIVDKAMFLPYAQRLQPLEGTFYGNLTVNLVIDIIWTAVFLVGAYAAFRHSDLK